MFANNRDTEPALGPALQAAVQSLQGTGGRALVFSTSLQLTGEGMDSEYDFHVIISSIRNSFPTLTTSSSVLGPRSLNRVNISRAWHA